MGFRFTSNLELTLLSHPLLKNKRKNDYFNKQWSKSRKLIFLEILGKGSLVIPMEVSKGSKRPILNLPSLVMYVIIFSPVFR